MSDETTQPPAEQGKTSPPGPPADNQPDGDIPVGDMTEEGETEVGPYPSLTHLENLEQADLEAVAKDEAERKTGRDERDT